MSDNHLILLKILQELSLRRKTLSMANSMGQDASSKNSP